MLLELKKISDNFISDLDKIQRENPKIIKRANKSIILCRNVLTKYKRMLLKNYFANQDEEITFFKYTKQIPLVPLIYYSEIRSFELQLPKANIQCQKKFIYKKLTKLNRFFIYNLDYVQYIENKHEHFDSQYYTRYFLDSFHITSSKFYFQDPDFSTARDMLLGKVKAYQRFIDYLNDRLITFNTNETVEYIQNKNNHNLQWTSSKTALTELIYALYFNRVINNGNIEIKEIANELQSLFHFDLGDFYKTYSEIKTRKISRTKFLDELAAGLLSQMDKSDN